MSNGDIVDVLDFRDRCEDLNKPYIFIVGNHDAYGKSFDELYAELDEYEINYLTQGKEFKFQDKIFVGGTFFTDFTYGSSDELSVYFNQKYAQLGIADFIHIKNTDTSDYITRHNKDWNWIQKYKNNPNVIVCTHFPPNPVALTDYWKINGGTLNPYFINTKKLNGFTLWVSGHVHDAFDKTADNCRVVCNPSGYKNEHNYNGFTSNLLIEI